MTFGLMSTKAALLSAIRDSPEDDMPRLAFADWLDEHEQPDRAEFIRAQVRAARLWASHRKTWGWRRVRK
jgi:uncharacterized protein (TIGR02996 family)